MPIYEYECPDCGAGFERYRPMAEAGLPVACPECGSQQPRKVVSSCFGNTSGGPGCAPAAPT